MLSPESRIYFYSRQIMDDVVFSFDRSASKKLLRSYLMFNRLKYISTFLSIYRFRKHASVLNIYPITSDKFAVRSYDFFHKQARLNHVWNRGKRITSTEHIFTSQSDFQVTILSVFFLYSLFKNKFVLLGLSFHDCH